MPTKYTHIQSKISDMKVTCDYTLVHSRKHLKFNRNLSFTKKFKMYQKLCLIS